MSCGTPTAGPFLCRFHPGRDMPKGTLRNVLAIIGMDIEELRGLL